MSFVLYYFFSNIFLLSYSISRCFSVYHSIRVSFFQSLSPVSLSVSLFSLRKSSLSLSLSLSSVWSIFVKPQINVQRRGSRKKLRVCSININIRFLSFSIVKKTFISKPQFFLQQTQFKLVVNCETIVIVLWIYMTNCVSNKLFAFVDHVY